MNRDEKEALYFKSLLIRLKKDSAVRVESEADIDFWESTLSTTLPHVKFEFFPQSIENGSGKKEVLLLKNYADRELVLCVDADYDYLLENTDYIGKPFVFHTYVYALENVFSYSEGLKDILEKAINTEGVTFDFEAFFNNYSTVIYDWLTYSLYSEKIKDGLLSRKDCGKIASFDKLSNLEKDLNDLKIRLENESKTFKDNYDSLDEFESLKIRLNELGLTKINAYLFLQCHNLYDRVTLKLMQFIDNSIYNERLDILKKENNIEEINRSQLGVKNKKYGELLKNNTTFQSSSFYKNIVSDIRKAFN